MASPGGPWGRRAVGRAWDTVRGLCPVPEGWGVCAGCFLSRDLGNSVGMGTLTSPDKGQVALGTHGSPVPIPAACQPSRRLCATLEQCCRFAGTLACPLGFSSSWAGWSEGQRVAFAPPGQAVTRPGPARTNSELFVCVWPGTRSSVNPANLPRHFYRGGPARSFPLAANPPGKRSPALAGGECLCGARPPRAGCQRAGAGPGWVRRGRDEGGGPASPPTCPSWNCASIPGGTLRRMGACDPLLVPGSLAS